MAAPVLDRARSPSVTSGFCSSSTAHLIFEALTEDPAVGPNPPIGPAGLIPSPKKTALHMQPPAQTGS
jgi:hypothetical protein